MLAASRCSSSPIRSTRCVDAVGEVDGKRLRSVAKGDVDLSGVGTDAQEDTDEPDAAEFADLLAWLGEAGGRGQAGAAVAPAHRVRGLHGGRRVRHDPQLEAMYRASGMELPTSKRILELNPSHPLVGAAQPARPGPVGGRVKDTARLIAVRRCWRRAARCRPGGVRQAAGRPDLTVALRPAQPDGCGPGGGCPRRTGRVAVSTEWRCRGGCRPRCGSPPPGPPVRAGGDERERPSARRGCRRQAVPVAVGQQVAPWPVGRAHRVDLPAGR